MRAVLIYAFIHNGVILANLKLFVTKEEILLTLLLRSINLNVSMLRSQVVDINSSSTLNITQSIIDYRVIVYSNCLVIILLVLDISFIVFQLIHLFWEWFRDVEFLSDVGYIDWFDVREDTNNRRKNLVDLVVVDVYLHGVRGF